MRVIFFTAIIVTVINSFAYTIEKKSNPEQPADAQTEVKTVNFDQLKTIVNKKDNKLYVVNFWATWCKPCVEELPDFMEVNSMYQKNSGFSMILVSLDPASEMNTAVKPFLQKHKINVPVYLLDDNKRMNEWIPAVDKSWTGSIPATVFYRNGVKLDFKEKQLHKNELQQLIKKHL